MEVRGTVEDGTVSAELHSVALEEAARLLLGRHHLVTVYSSAGTLIEVRAIGNRDGGDRRRTRRDERNQRLADLVRDLGQPDVRRREQAVEELGRIGGMEVGEVLAQTLRGDPHEYVRAAAVAAWVKVGAGGLGAAPLREALADEASWVRSAAIEALAKVGGATAVGALGQVLLEDASARVREHAVEILARLGGDAVGPLSIALEDGDEWVRERAGRALLAIANASKVSPGSPTP